MDEQSFTPEVSIKDYDGNEYKTVRIGGQVWMAENLRASHYQDGSKIEGSFLYSKKDKATEKYGRFYTWNAAIDERSICPEGWKIPSDQDWQQLEESLGMASEEIKKSGWRGKNHEGLFLKAKQNNTLLAEYKEKGVNKFGFTARAAGVRTPLGFAVGRNNYADFWTSTEKSKTKAINRSLVWLLANPNKGKIFRSSLNKSWGMSIRCIKVD